MFRSGEKITPLLEAAQALKVLGIIGCRNADLLLSELLMSRPSERSYPHTPEPGPIADYGGPKNHRQHKWKFPLLSLKHINFLNNSISEETYVAQMVIDLLQNRSDSLHVKTDLVKCREICHHSSNDSEGEDSKTKEQPSGFGGRLVIVEGQIEDARF